MKINSKIKQWFSRGTLVAVAVGFTVATVAAQPAQAQGGIIASLRCAAVKTFKATAVAAINIEAAVMEESFKLALSLLETGWKVQDAATEAARKAAIAVFNGLMNLYQQIRANTTDKIAAVKKFKLDALLSLSLFHDDYDAAQGSYREDLLALIKAYQEDLRDLVAKFKADIVKASDDALKNCSKLGLLVELAAKAAKAKVELVAGATGASVKALGKATQLLTTRNLEILRQIAVLLQKVYEHKVKMVNVIRGWN